jgi:outer membrane protein
VTTTQCQLTTGKHLMILNAKLFVMAATLSLSCSLMAAVKDETPGGENNRGQIEKYGFIYGLGIGVNNGLYKNYDLPIIPLPIIGYRDEDFSVYGPFVSYHFFKQDGLKLSLNAAPRFGGFDEDDADIFSGMKERKISLDAGLGLSYKNDDWKLTSSAMLDMLGRSKGFEVKTSVGKMMRFGPVFIEPSVGLSYLDAKHVGYYYGVDSHEATVSRMSYEGGSALNKTVGLAIMTPIFFKGITALNFENTWYDTSISDSPLIEGNTSLSIRFTFSKFF